MEGGAGHSIITVVVAFIVVAIVISIGIQILGSSVQNCDNLSGFNSTTPASSTGWAGSCEKANTQTQTAINLLIIVLIVIAAAAIISVLRFMMM
jgi:predicted S18 family serine protease